MSETFTEAQGLLFADMDTRAREVVEKKFRVRLDSAQSSENQQAAWEVYQNATVKLIKAIGSGVTFGDAKGYAATVARNSCRDYWRVYNPGWADLKGRHQTPGGCPFTGSIGSLTSHRPDNRSRVNANSSQMVDPVLRQTMAVVQADGV